MTTTPKRETLEYISVMLEQLEQTATVKDEPLLAYLIGMAKLETKMASSKPSRRKRTPSLGGAVSETVTQGE